MSNMLDTQTPARISEVPVIEEIRDWFAEADGEVAVGPARIEGHLPGWLQGTLLRNGASGFGNGAARHLLDGSALLHRFAFPGDGTASYASRFLQTKARAAMKDGRIGYHEFASDPCRRIAEPIATLFSPRYTDNASVNVAKLGEQFLALTETPIPVAFDPETLATLGVADAPPGRGPRTPTAHPHMDPRTGGWITTQVHFGLRSSYRIYLRRPDGTSLLLARIPVCEPGYLHSFAVTERFVVLVEQPLRLRPLDLMKPGKAFIEQYTWRPELGTTFIVVDRRTGEVVRRHQGPALFVFHHVNAFDDGAGIVVDLCGYEDPSIIDSLYLDPAGRIKAATIPTARLRRFRLTPGCDATETFVTDAPLEWPRIAPAMNGRDYTAAYGGGAVRDGDGYAATITKVNPSTGETTHWHAHGCMPGEPVVAARPGGADEHDGVVMAVVFDATHGHSFIAVLDAATLHEVARVHAPVRVPFGFHGDYFPAA